MNKKYSIIIFAILVVLILYNDTRCMYLSPISLIETGKFPISKERPYDIDNAIKEGRLFVIDNLPTQRLSVIASGTLEEVTDFFYGFLGKIDKTARKNLMNNLRSKEFRTNLYSKFHSIMTNFITRKPFANARFGIILEKEVDPSYEIPSKFKSQARVPSFEELFYCTVKESNHSQKPLICIGFNIMNEIYLNRNGLRLVIEHKLRDFERGNHVDPREEVKEGFLTEDKCNLLYEFYEELTGIQSRKIQNRVSQYKLPENSKSDNLEEFLFYVFGLDRFAYDYGNVVHDRFIPMGSITLDDIKYPYYSIEFREYFYRVGNIFVVDSQYKDLLPKEIDSSEAMVIFMDFRAETNSIKQGTRTWSDYRFGTIGILLALQYMDMKDKVIVDAGTGNGILSIVAAKLGAKRIILLEGTEHYREIVRKNALINGVNEKLDYQFFGDTFKTLNKKFKGSKGIEVDIMLANIPFWGLPTEDEIHVYEDNLIWMLIKTFPPDIYIASGSDYGWIGILNDAIKTFNKMGLSVDEVIELKNCIGMKKPTFILANQYLRMRRTKKFDEKIQQKDPIIYTEQFDKLHGKKIEKARITRVIEQSY